MFRKPSIYINMAKNKLRKDKEKKNSRQTFKTRNEKRRENPVGIAKKKKKTHPTIELLPLFVPFFFSVTQNRRKSYIRRFFSCFFFFSLFFILRRMGKNKAFRSSPHFHVFPYASCVDFTQLLSQPNASWRTLRVPL